MNGLALHRLMPWALLFLLIAFPFLANALGQTYYIGFVRHILITGIAAVSLNFILGYGGMVALGQAGFAGVGAYTLIALMASGIESFWVMLVAAAFVALVISFIIGFVSLRTRGIYFIMITLAFAQMLYYVAASATVFGGDDGYSLLSSPLLSAERSIDDEALWYAVVLAIAWFVFFAFDWISESHFGHALAGIRDNESRMTALGCPVFRYKLAAFSGAGMATGVAGALAVADSGFYSPSSMHWTMSAILIVMVVLGGVGRIWGTLLGVVAWLLAEEFLRQYTNYWHWIVGLSLIAVVMFAPRGLATVWNRGEGK